MGALTVCAHKTCRVCGETKLRDQFGKDRTKRDGHGTICNPCNRAKVKEWAKTADPERVRANMKRWLDANREKSRRKSLAYYYSLDPETRRKRKRAWKARNRDKVAAENHARRAERYDDESKGTIGVLLDDPCAYCGGPGGEIDHIIPIAAGGENHWSNITAACRSCNPSKGARPLLLWMAAR